MTIYDEIKEELQEKWNSGRTQHEIAEQSNLKQPYIHQLLSGSRKIENMKLETFFKLFPKASVKIHGDSVVADNSGVVHGVVGVNNGTVHADSSAAVEKFRAELISEIIMLDEQVTKDQILKTIAVHGKGK